MRRTFTALLLAAALASSAAPGFAADAKSDAGKMIFTSDGKRVGRIDRVVADAAGAPESAAVIYDSKFIHVPYATLTPGDNGRLVTSLTQKELRSLR
jgi:hypothetical protein